jgi:hypothetical protein
MCFSASASFSAGVVLTVIGIITIKKTHHRSQLLFASIPLIFGVQQIAEGILWLSLPNPDYPNTQKIATYTFLLFAQIIWPIWTPIAILLLEKKETRNKIQRFFVGAGILVGLYLGYCLVLFHVEARIESHHIIYIQNYPVNIRFFSILFYGLATIAPAFFSHVKGMWLLAITILLAYIISEIFYDNYLLSVWCFFSSIISIAVFKIMKNISLEKKEINSNLTVKFK